MKTVSDRGRDAHAREVRGLLRQRILDLYAPDWSLESAEDHGVDWLVLTRQEFESIKKEAIAERRTNAPDARG